MPCGSFRKVSVTPLTIGNFLVIIIIIKDQTRQHIISIFNFHSFHLKMLLTAKVRFSFPYPKPAKSFQIYLIYLRRQQERGLMQKARRLMDENSVSFQMFLIPLVLYYIWFRKPNFCVQTMSEQYLEVWALLFKARLVLILD